MQYHPPKQIPNNLELPIEQVADADVEIVREFNNVLQEELTTNQSRRFPRASNKYLKLNCKIRTLGNKIQASSDSIEMQEFLDNLNEIISTVLTV